MTFQPAPRNTPFKFLDDFSVASDGSVKALQVAVDDPFQIVEGGSTCQGDRAEGFGFVAFAVAEKAHTLLCEVSSILR